MAGLCEDGNEPSGSLKAICNSEFSGIVNPGFLQLAYGYDHSYSIVNKALSHARMMDDMHTRITNKRHLLPNNPRPTQKPSLQTDFRNNVVSFWTWEIWYKLRQIQHSSRHRLYMLLPRRSSQCETPSI
ncbi:hypothetical protein ANN_04703 [Periplaneta americana]|uniref:Uncharacterized protein n=1 Tax=Periplaneta americana TaxID=6978 RepID=A0ABQ8T944_PERAM|nr:hypothetical protein ANN_04703 [Periplaneta americana]